MEYNWFRGWCIMKICYIAPLWRLRWHGHERYRTHLAFKYIVDKVAGLRTILYTNGCGLSMSFVSIHLIKLYERFKDIPCIIFYHWILKNLKFARDFHRKTNFLSLQTVNTTHLRSINGQRGTKEQRHRNLANILDQLTQYVGSYEWSVALNTSRSGQFVETFERSRKKVCSLHS